MFKRRFAERGALIHHIKSCHQDYPLAPSKSGQTGIRQLRHEVEYYNSVMKIHDEHVTNVLRTEQSDQDAQEEDNSAQEEVAQCALEDSQKASAAIFDVPLYKSGNKKRRQVKGKVSLHKYALNTFLTASAKLQPMPAGII